MPNGVLPALPVCGVVGEGGHDPEVDVRQGHLSTGAGIQDIKYYNVKKVIPGIDCHCDHSNV